MLTTKEVVTQLVRIKSGPGIHCGHHSLESLLQVPSYLSSQGVPLPRLATST